MTVDGVGAQFELARSQMRESFANSAAQTVARAVSSHSGRQVSAQSAFNK